VQAALDKHRKNQWTLLQWLSSGLPGRELMAGPGWKALNSLTIIPHISPSSRGTSKINTGIKKGILETD